MPTLEHDPAVRMAGEVALECRRRGADPLGGADLPAGIHRAELGEAIAEIEADR